MLLPQLLVVLSIVILAMSLAAPMATNSGAAIRAQKVLAAMNLTEKLSLMHGYVGVYVGNVRGLPHLGVPEVRMQDGPQGFRVTPTTGKTGSTTAWPSALTVSSSFDTDLAYRWATAMAAEFRGKGANMQLGPGIGLARVPTAGRNFEYLCGEDPYLGAGMVAPVVRGIQEHGVLANAKHWINNEIETDRKKVSADVSERTRFEIYYPPFQSAVDAGVLTMMCSYNRINGVSSCENDETFADLRNKLGFQGWVVSDWLATYSSSPSVNAGLETEMPLGIFLSEKELMKQLDAGNIVESKVDEHVTRILTSLFSMDFHDSSYVPFGSPTSDVTSEEHNTLAREIAAKAAVLLKNTNNVLPLDMSTTSFTRGKCIAVFGDSTTVAGGGSGHVTPAYIVTPEAGIRNAVSGSDVEVVYFPTPADLSQATASAASCEVAVVVVATTSTEGNDRATLSLGSAQDDLVRAVLAGNPQKTIVAVNNPGAVLMPWADQAPAIIASGMPGQEAGNALADVIFGKVNPSGRLPVTIPNQDNEIGFTPEQFPGVGKPPRASYSEELLVGYRWYQAQGVKPVFPFGHGLSYTQFQYGALDAAVASVGRVVHDTDEVMTVAVTVTNSGERAGNEVVQLYLSFPSQAQEPPRQLRGFVKTSLLAPGAAETVKVTLKRRDVSVWDDSSHAWSLIPGEYQVMVGASSEDIRATQKVMLK